MNSLTNALSGSESLFEEPGIYEVPESTTPLFEARRKRKRAKTTKAKRRKTTVRGTRVKFSTNKKALTRITVTIPRGIKAFRS
tara:strand:+ start:3316 stop:3564 length:249 start_codon:yes stop_codon:yes gene_type:complete